MTPSTPPSAGNPPFELMEASIADLAVGMSRGRRTARSIAEEYLRRIGELDRNGPRINSVIEINPDALALADALDREREEGRTRGPLHGIPVLLKDNIDTADKMMTTAGSLALLGSHPARDAFLVSRLREAGAVILGKTNLSEWANIRSERSTSGWSARGGLTRNPYALDRNTSGSSSGSAAAVSANFCSAAVGTETDGSIVSPSSCCGIVGIKPTVGLISRAGVIPISHSQDTPGPMARTVEDAALLLGVLAGVDPQDPATGGETSKRPASGRSKAGAAPSSRSNTGGRTPERGGHGDYSRFLDADGLAGARIGVVRRYFGFHPAVDEIAEAAIDLLRERGAILVDPVDLPGLATVDDYELAVLEYELKADMDAYLGGLGPEVAVHSLTEVIEFNERNKEREMPYFGQEFFMRAARRGSLEEREYVEAIDACRRLSRTEGIDLAMDGHNLDALVAPTGAPAWLIDLVDGDHFLGGSAQAAAVAGYPSITVPAGFAAGLPVGISFFGRAYSEPVLIKIAYAFEQGSGTRRPPRFKPSAEVGP